MSRTTLIKFWIAAAILGALLVGRHAHAGEIPNMCAVVMPTDDGFLALRSDPSTNYGTRKAKLHAGDYLYIDSRAYGPTPWVFVYVRDADPRSPASAGWVYSTYIQPFSCS